MVNYQLHHQMRSRLLKCRLPIPQYLNWNLEQYSLPSNKAYCLKSADLASCYPNNLGRRGEDCQPHYFHIRATIPSITLRNYLQMFDLIFYLIRLCRNIRIHRIAFAYCSMYCMNEQFKIQQNHLRSEWENATI